MSHAPTSNAASETTPPESRQQALAWLKAQGHVASEQARERLERALERWPEDLGIAEQAVEALLRTAATRPRDEPVLGEGPAHGALAQIDAALSAEGVNRARWTRLRALALARLPTDRDADACEAFRLALQACPEDAALRLDCARFHAWRGRFREALDAIEAAADAGTRETSTLAATYATALGLGARAVQAWQALGLPASVREGSGMPEVPGIPDAQLRVPARGAAPLGLGGVPEGAAAFEVLSVAALSPVHGVVQSASLLDAVVDYGDVVLWEPIPVAVTGEGELRVPCFPLLEILHRGDELRLRILAVARSGEALACMEKALAGLATLAWHLNRTTDTGTQVALGKLLLPNEAALPEVLSALESLRDESLALACPGLYERAAKTDRAGKEHKAWGALERKAERLLGARSESAIRP